MRSEKRLHIFEYRTPGGISQKRTSGVSRVDVVLQRFVQRVRGILLVNGTEMADSVLGRDVSPETAETMGRLFQSRRMAFLHTDFLSTFELEMV